LQHNRYNRKNSPSLYTLIAFFATARKKGLRYKDSNACLLSNRVIDNSSISFDMFFFITEV
jgi:hypothetical protein